MTPFQQSDSSYLEHGERLLKSRQHDDALSALRSAVNMSHANSLRLSRARRALGELYRMTGDITRSKMELDEALALVSSNSRRKVPTSKALRLLAELEQDKAARFREGQLRDAAFDRVDLLLDKAETAMQSCTPMNHDANELSMIKSLKGARMYERGEKREGLRQLREQADRNITTNTVYHVIICLLRLMKYSPIDRWTSFWRILQAIETAKTTKASPYQAYKPLALRALIGLPVKL